jgi:hypothetical protein
MTVHTDTGSRQAAKSSGVARAAALLVAGFFVLHALAHLVGIQGIWGIGAEATNSATYLITGLDPHSAAYAALGGVWLAACALFIVAAAGIVLRRSWWLPAAFAAAGISLVLCIVWQEAAIAGLVVNAVILVGLAVWTVVCRGAGAH